MQGCTMQALLQTHAEEDNAEISQEKAAETWCLRLSPHQTCREHVLLLCGTTARLFQDNRPAGLSSRETGSFILHSTLATQHLHDRYLGSFTLITLSHSPQPKEVAATAPQLRTSREEPRSQHAGDFAPLGVQAELSTAASPPEPSTGLFSKVTHGHSCLIHSLAQLQNIHWNHFHPVSLRSISSSTMYYCRPRGGSV